VKYNFEWDIRKARVNELKHKVSFDLAASIFQDPKALTIFDDSHSDFEERWITLGISSKGILLVVIHTYIEVDPNNAAVRIISARKANRKEKQQYLEV
jgi:uncharacterized protein